MCLTPNSRVNINRQMLPVRLIWKPPGKEPVSAFLREIVECPTVSIPLADGARLAAQVFEPSWQRAPARR